MLEFPILNTNLDVKSIPSEKWLSSLDQLLEELLLAEFFTNKNDFNLIELSEFELTQKLIQTGLFPANCLKSPESMFDTHFLIKGALYRLQKKWFSEELANIKIELTRISIYFLNSSSNFSNQLSADQQQSDIPLSHRVYASDGSFDTDRKLYDYYHDWSIFTETKGEDVVQMIDDFWTEFAKFQPLQQPKASESELMDHLSSLELTPKLESLNELTAANLKKRYRKLAHKHHPDKGGRKSKFIEIQTAFFAIKSYIQQNQPQN